MAERFPYERHTAWGGTEEERKRWSDELERIGLTIVKLRLRQDAKPWIKDFPAGLIVMPKGFADEWAKWQISRQPVQTRWWVKPAAWGAISGAVAGFLIIVWRMMAAK